jgi:hypothetical protein
MGREGDMFGFSERELTRKEQLRKGMIPLGPDGKPTALMWQYFDETLKSPYMRALLYKDLGVRDDKVPAVRNGE